MIKIGDLVVVVRLPSCGCAQALGEIFQVTDFVDTKTPHCIHCQAPRPAGPAAMGSPTGFSIELDRLKRIPPIDELDKLIVEEKNTVTA